MRSGAGRRSIWQAAPPQFPRGSGGREPPGCLPTFELRLALAEECRDPFLRVLRAERPAQGLALGAEPLLEVAVGRHRLDLLDRERSLLGELAGPRQCGVEQLV